MGDLLKNIFTFGAYGRIQKKLKEFEKTKTDLEKQIDELNDSKKQVNRQLKCLVKTKRKSVKTLKKMTKISKLLTIKDRQYAPAKYDQTTIDANLIKAEQTISIAEIAMTTSKGIGVGVSTVMGSWALVGSYGTASTGTLIVSLSGQAATNATLAWFGGGSVAAGGGGVAAGSMVLGGIVLVPVLVIIGIFSHISANKKIKEIEEKMLELVKITEQYRKAQLVVKLIGKRSIELNASLIKARDAFQVSLKIALRKIYPIPILSRIYKWVRKIFGHKYFNKKDLDEIALVGKAAKDFAAMIDTKILDKNGNLI